MLNKKRKSNKKPQKITKITSNLSLNFLLRDHFLLNFDFIQVLLVKFPSKIQSKESVNKFSITQLRINIYENHFKNYMQTLIFIIAILLMTSLLWFYYKTIIPSWKCVNWFVAVSFYVLRALWKLFMAASIRLNYPWYSMWTQLWRFLIVAIGQKSIPITYLLSGCIDKWNQRKKGEQFHT